MSSDTIHKLLINPSNFKVMNMSFYPVSINFILIQNLKII